MKIVLRKSLENLGEAGEVVNVKDGYARNCLIPSGMAYPATDSSLKQVEIEKRKAALRARKELEEARALSEKISALSVTIPVMVGEDEKMFGSVTSLDICKALASQGFELDRKKILLPEPLKELGVYTVKVGVHREVESSIKVWVVEK